MRYELINSELLKLLDDPLKDGQKLISYKPFWARIGRLLLKLGFPIPFVNSLMRHALFHAYVSAAEKVAKIINLPVMCENNTKPSIDDTIKAIGEIQKFFNLGIRFPKPPEPHIKNDADAYISLQLEHIVGYQCNRVSEYINNKQFNLFAISQKNKDIFLVFFTSEMIFLLQNNLLNVSIDWMRREVVLRPTMRLLSQLRLYWFNEAFEFTSNVASLGMLHMVYKDINLDRHMSNVRVDWLIDYFLDKIFSIKASRLERAIFDSEQFQSFREIIAVCSFVEYFKSVNIDFLVNQAQISLRTIKLLKDTVGNNKTDILTSPGNFILFNNHKIIRGNLSFRYGLRLTIGRLFDLPYPGNTLKDFRGDLGISFEKYVLSELKSLYHMGYKSFEGFKPDAKSPIRGYDIDLILYDEKNNIYYFIQVKYWFSASPTYLSERFKLFNGDKIQDGITRQLQVLKENFENPVIRNKLRHHGISGATKQNSYFILLHNIPFLNYYESDGIYLYEWNLLRNIIKNCRVSFVGVGNEKIWDAHSSARIPLHNLQAIVDEYFKMEDMSEELHQRWDYYKNAWVLYELNNLRIRAKLI
jgi:hypothetical protein